ncbi:MAG TPA: TetR/AcrR family transcriptional regulator [Polyangia bacterium]
MPRPSDPNARAKLLAAAAQVFGARGLEDAKVEDIAAAAGLAKGSFYLHFESKDHAFRQLVEVVLTRMKAKVEAIPEHRSAPGQSFEAMLESVIDHDAELFEFLWTNRALVQLLLDGGQCAAYRHLVDSFYEEAANKTRRTLQLGVESGMYRADLDVEVATAFISGAYDQLARQTVRADERPDFRKMLGTMQRLVLCGIGSGPTLVRLGAVTAAPAGAESPRTKRAGRRALSSPSISSKSAKSAPKARKRASR